MALIAFDGTGNEDKPGEDKVIPTSCVSFGPTRGWTRQSTHGRTTGQTRSPAACTWKASAKWHTRSAAIKWPRHLASAPFN